MEEETQSASSSLGEYLDFKVFTQKTDFLDISL